MLCIWAIGISPVQDLLPPLFYELTDKLTLGLREVIIARFADLFTAARTFWTLNSSFCPVFLITLISLHFMIWNPPHKPFRCFLIFYIAFLFIACHGVLFLSSRLCGTFRLIEQMTFLIYLKVQFPPRPHSGSPPSAPRSSPGAVPWIRHRNGANFLRWQKVPVFPGASGVPPRTPDHTPQAG